MMPSIQALGGPHGPIVNEKDNNGGARWLSGTAVFQSLLLTALGVVSLNLSSWKIIFSLTHYGDVVFNATFN